MSWWKSSKEANNAILGSDLWYEAKGIAEYPNFWKKHQNTQTPNC